MSGGHNLCTFIGRVADSMMLIESMDSAYELDEYRKYAKTVLADLQKGSPPSKCTVEVGQYLYHYLVEGGVCYMALAERGFPRGLAFAYLEKLQQMFARDHGHEVHMFDRPYAAVKFDPKMSRLRREMSDPRSPANVGKLNTDLAGIRNIMVSNIEEVMRRGEKLDTIENKSSSLVADSKKFEKASKYIRFQYMLRTVGPLVGVLLVVLAMVYWKLAM